MFKIVWRNSFRPQTRRNYRQSNDQRRQAPRGNSSNYQNLRSRAFAESIESPADWGEVAGMISYGGWKATALIRRRRPFRTSSEPPEDGGIDRSDGLFYEAFFR
jgi:hypothetical protein